MNLRIIRFIAVVAVILVVVIKMTDTMDSRLSSEAKTTESEQSGEALIGGSFSLVNQDGKTINSGDFAGKNMLVYFGFSSCPDICPTDLMLISSVVTALGDDAKRVQPIFITIDPERDTPPKLKAYLENFHPDIIGLTGTQEQIADVINKYRIYAKKVQNEEVGEYLMDHSAFIYLMGRDGKYVTHFNGKQSVEEITSKIKEKL